MSVPDQVRALREAVEDKPGIPARLLVDLLYGCGLRVSEPLELRVKDILWAERQLVIRDAKGAKDRRVPIPDSLFEPLRTQVEMARFAWEDDRKCNPPVGVPLPHQLARKYPSAPFSWAWFWVFPARSHCRDPRTGATVRYHLLHDRLQQAVRMAAQKIGLEGFITPHVLRHGYATHSRESIEALRQIMGHYSIETTAGYRHPVVESASNPLDDLVTESSAFPSSNSRQSISHTSYHPRIPIPSHSRTDVPGTMVRDQYGPPKILPRRNLIYPPGQART